MTRRLWSAELETEPPAGVRHMQVVCRELWGLSVGGCVGYPPLVSVQLELSQASESHTLSVSSPAASTPTCTSSGRSTASSACVPRTPLLCGTSHSPPNSDPPTHLPCLPPSSLLALNSSLIRLLLVPDTSSWLSLWPSTLSSLPFFVYTSPFTPAWNRRVAWLRAQTLEADKSGLGFCFFCLWVKRYFAFLSFSFLICKMGSG